MATSDALQRLKISFFFLIDAVTDTTLPPPPKWLNFIKRYFTHKTIERLSASLEIKSDYFWDRFNVSEVLIQTKITQYFFFYFWNEY